MIPPVSSAASAPAAATGAVARPAGPSFRSVLESVSGPRGARPGETPGRAHPTAKVHTPASPTRLLEAVDRARARLDGVLAAARSGRTFTAQELLGLQAEAYRTVQTVDLGAKLVEQGAQAVRQTLATQV